jgi:hypothetical protein
MGGMSWIPRTGRIHEARLSRAPTRMIPDKEAGKPDPQSKKARSCSIPSNLSVRSIGEKTRFATFRITSNALYLLLKYVSVTRQKLRALEYS